MEEQHLIVLILGWLVLLLTDVLRRLATVRRLAERSAAAADEAVGSEPVLPPLALGELASAVRSIRSLVADERLIDAGALCVRVQTAIAAAPAGSSEAAAARRSLGGELRPGLTAKELVRRHASLSDALRSSFGGERGGWRCVKDEGATRAFVKRTDDGLIWAKTEGEVDAPMMDVIGILNETDLYAHWYPAAIGSSTIAQVGRAEKCFRIVFEIKVPFLGEVQYDMVSAIYGADALASAGAFVVCGADARQADWPTTPFPPPPAPGRRQKQEALSLVLRPAAGGRRALVSLSIAVRPQPVVAALPHWVFDFVICAILGKVFKTIQEVAARMRAAPDTDRHAVAIRANRAFYQDFLAPRVAAAAKLHSA